jgi:hypothetical protein
MKRFNWTIMGALAGILLLTSPARSEEKVNMTAETDAGRALCELLDLERPELAAVKDCIDREDFSGALTAYRDRIVDLAAGLDLGEPPGFWLWTATDAEELLGKGIVATAQYGEFDRVSRYTLGPPGAADWNAIPDDGYDVVLRDLATMHWTGRLLEVYRKDPDPAYLRAYLGYWDDFARNWLPAHQQLLHDETLIQWDSQPHVQKSIPWASGSKLYFAWRLDNLFSWLPIGLAVSPEQARQTLDPQQLAAVLLHVVRFEIPGALHGLEEVGTPNQFVHCALGLLKASLLLQDMREGPAWIRTAIERMEWYVDIGGNLADGSDMEQSFNYNPGLIHALDSILQLARANPPLKGREFPWLTRFQEIRDYRERFLDSIAMPDGRRPATGCDNTWGYSRDAAAAAYAQEKGSLSPLREGIHNHLLGDGTAPAPAFSSIYFPHGGWVAMRDSWTPGGLYAFMKTSRPAPGHMREGGNGLAMAAYGRYLLVNSGDEAYSERGVFNRYFYSTVSQSSVSVDGYSQLLNDTGSKPQYDRPIPTRWHSSSHFDVAEGIFDSPYGGWNFRTGETQEPQVDDVRHVRQLLFLRQAGIWIVTDRITSTVDHEYAQSWCFGPEFAEGEVTVDSAENTVVTHSSSGANVELRFFSTSGLTFGKHFGEKSETTALGWRALDWNEAQQRYTPAVDLLTEWSGAGEQLVVTLIVPSPAQSNRILHCRNLSSDGIAGFSVDLLDGMRVTYLVSSGGELKAEGVGIEGQGLLLSTAPEAGTRGLVLQADGVGGQEFELDGAGALRKIADIRVPGGFRWTGTGGNIEPEYD